MARRVSSQRERGSSQRKPTRVVTVANRYFFPPAGRLEAVDVPPDFRAERTIDGLENPLTDIISSKFYEVAKQIVLTNHQVSNTFFTMPVEFWNGLSPEEQAAIEGARKPVEALLKSLPSWGRRALASDATAAMWGETYDTRVMQKYMRAMAAQQHALLDKTYGALDPDLPEFMTEAADLAALVYDTAGTVEIGADRVDARFDLNLL